MRKINTPKEKHYKVEYYDNKPPIRELFDWTSFFPVGFRITSSNTI